MLRNLEHTNVEDCTTAVNTALKGTFETSVYVSRANWTGQKIDTVTLISEKRQGAKGM